MKTNYKYDHIAQDIREVLTNILNEDIKGCEYVSITDVSLTKDMGDCKIYLQCLDSKDEDDILKTINKHQKLLKEGLAQNLKIRKIPNLIFKFDHSLDNYNQIESLLNKEKMD